MTGTASFTSPRGSGGASFHCAKHELSSTSAESGRWTAWCVSASSPWYVRDSWIHAAALGAGFLLWAEQAPGFPIRRSVATINSASLDYAAGSRLLRRVKGRGSEKIITNTGDLTLPHEFKARRTQLVGCHHACEGPSFRGLSAISDV